MGKGEKIIVFSMFTSALYLIKESIKKNLDMECIQIDGSVTGVNRDSRLETFKTDSEYKILLMTYKTGSEGLNLYMCKSCDMHRTMVDSFCRGSSSGSSMEKWTKETCYSISNCHQRYY